MLDSNRNGIVAGGNWIVDHLKLIDLYPQEDALANIKGESYSNGGSAYNVLKNLAKLGAPFPLKGIGLIGDDNFGDQIREDCINYCIDTESLRVQTMVGTSYTDVMTVESTGRRTFFHSRGANAFLNVEHFDFSKTNAKLFHLGYLLLLDSLDITYEDGTNGAICVLEKAVKAGLKTSVDLVSEDSKRYEKIVTPTLPFVHYLFLNEFEATGCTGIDLISNEPKFKTLNQAATKILSSGVKEWVFIHFSHGVFAKSSLGDILTLGSLELPKNKIIGAAGAGDAFASGVLFALHEGWTMINAMELGVCCAAACLQDISCSKGILPYKECLKLKDSYGFRKMDKN